MRRTLRRKIRWTRGGVHVAADVHAVVASGTATSGTAPPGDANVVSSRQRVRIVQRSRATTDTTSIETENAGGRETAGETGENR